MSTTETAARKQYLTEDGDRTCIYTDTTVAEDVVAIFRELRGIERGLTQATLNLGSLLSVAPPQEEAMQQYLEVVSGCASVRTQVSDLDGLRSKVEHMEGNGA